ncbi:hypothetical protein XENOCAPTIV_007396 [Xenoophorus captivus]|uniref:NUCB1-like N-terminal domain-containing protein n=1 Tax=Xenoophorus captivus TaxID=1517983 RepID=A0ABV0QH01_9TELE
MTLINVRLPNNCEPSSVCQDTGLHYDRYLREVIEYLEKDPHFREKLKNANMDDIKVHTHLENRTIELSVYLHMLFNLNIAVGTLCLQQGKLSKELDFVQHNFRTKLDELKREEMNRLRLLIKAKHDVQEGNGNALDHQALLKQFEHLNHMNPHTFEVEDLDRLIQSTAMEMASLTKVSWKLSLQKRYHCDVLGQYLNQEAFVATFVCFFKLEKVYNPANEEDDMVEMEEERLRMREHVMNEVSMSSQTDTAWSLCPTC